MVIDDTCNPFRISFALLFHLAETNLALNDWPYKTWIQTPLGLMSGLGSWGSGGSQGRHTAGFHFTIFEMNETATVSVTSC